MDVTRVPRTGKRLRREAGRQQGRAKWKGGRGRHYRPPGKHERPERLPPVVGQTPTVGHWVRAVIGGRRTAEARLLQGRH